MPLGRRRPSRAETAVHRRMFLKAMALGMSVPAAMRLARMATAQAARPPKRFFLMYIPHGAPPEHFNPKIAGANPTVQANYTEFDLDQSNISILAPLQPYKQYVNVYQGFQYPGMAQTHDGSINCLSGSMAVDTTTARTSFEQVIAKALNVRPPLILGACSHITNGLDKNGMMFWNNTPIDPEKSPVKAFDSLFGGATTAPPVSADVQLYKDLLAFTASEVQGLQTSLQSLTSEQTKLATHLASMQSLQADANTMMPVSVCSTKPTLPSVEMVRTRSAGNMPQPGGGNDYFYKEENFQLLLAAQLELVTQALICNAAPIIGLMPMFPTCDFDFGFAGAPGAHHLGLSHVGHVAAPYPKGQYNSPLGIDNVLAETRTPFAKAQKWFMTQVVNKLVSVLATTDDPAAPGTKVLDNTLIYLFSEIGDGQDHSRVSQILYPQTPSSLPLITIGKCAGAIKSGQVVQHPIAAKEMADKINRPAADIYLTIARAMGAMNATFPGQTAVLPGVLT